MQAAQAADHPDSETGTGNLTVTINARDRQVLATTSSVSTISITVTPSNNSVQTASLPGSSINSGAASTTFSKLSLGSANVAVSAYDANDFLVGVASSIANISLNQTSTASLAIQLVPDYQNATFSVSAYGGLAADLSFTNGATYANSGVVSTLTMPGQVTYGQIEQVVGDSSGNFYLPDESYGRVVKITADLSTASVFAGTPQGNNPTNADADGTGTSAQFNVPYAIAIDGSNNLYVGEWGGHTVREITPMGVVTTLAGNGTAGTVDGATSSAEFQYIVSLAVTSDGSTVYVGQSIGGVRKIAGGQVTTVASKNSNNAMIEAEGLALDAMGDLYVADRGNDVIEEIPAGSGTATPVAGGPSAQDIDGQGTSASLNAPFAIATDRRGNCYFSTLPGQTSNAYRIRQLTTAGMVQTLAGDGVSAMTDGTGNAAAFTEPTGLWISPSGVIFVMDHSTIRKIQ